MLWLLFITLITDLMKINGHPQVVEQDSVYQRIQLTDSSSMEVYKGADSIFVVMTVCAPQCSSCARIYNKEWQLIATPQSPTPSIFPLATIENGQIVWKDNDTWEY